MSLRLKLMMLFVALAAAIAGAGASLYLRPAGEALVLTRDAPPSDIEGMLWPNPKQVKPFQLVDHEGRPFDLDRLKGQWSFLFFGYTHCPDVCPMALDTMKHVTRKLQQRGAGQDVQVVFVSVDPERDTPAHLGSYVTYFDPDFVGATGEPDQLLAMTRQLGIIYDIQEHDEGDSSYLVDHSAAILLTDPEARVVGVFSAPHEPTEITERFQSMRGFIAEHS